MRLEAKKNCAVEAQFKKREMYKKINELALYGIARMQFHETKEGVLHEL